MRDLKKKKKTDLKNKETAARDIELEKIYLFEMVILVSVMASQQLPSWVKYIKNTLKYMTYWF